MLEESISCPIEFVENKKEVDVGSKRWKKKKEKLLWLNVYAQPN